MSLKKCIEKYEKFFVDDLYEEIEANRKRNKNDVIVRKIPNKSREVLEVEQLSCNINPVSKPSEKLDNLLKKRESEHELVMCKLAEELNELNMKIEKNIRISSEEVKALMKQKRDHVREVLHKLDVQEIVSYHQSVFLDLQKEADEMRSEQLEAVEDLYRDLCKFEDLRSDENVKILGRASENISKIGYMLPFDLQTFMEFETLKMNQLMLNNRRCYEDLKLKLVLVTEQMYKQFVDEAYCLKEKWLNIKKFEDSGNDRNFVQKSHVTIPNPIERLELKRHELSVSLTEDKCYNLVRVKDWYDNVTDSIDTMSKHLSVIIDWHKKVVEVITKSFNQESDEARKSLLQNEFLEYKTKKMQPILFESFGGTDEDLNSLETIWQYCLIEMKNESESAIRFLYRFEKLWSRHFKRLCESKLLILQALDKEDQKSRVEVQDLEVKLNINLDNLRTESNKEKLENLLGQVENSLEEIKAKLEGTHLSKVSILEEYYKMMNLEADVFTTDIKEFIQCSHPGEIDVVSINKALSTPDSATTIMFDFSTMNQIDLISTKMYSLRDWQQKVFEALELFTQKTRENLESRAEEWVDQKVQELSGKMEIQMEIHSKRYDRIRSQVYEVRLHELLLHSQVYDQHKAGLEDVLRKLRDTIDRVTDGELGRIEEMKVELSSMVERAKQEERPGCIKSTIIQVRRAETEFEAQVSSQIQELLADVEVKLSIIKQSNLKFMKNIKLFHENGNYEAEEAKTYVNLLENIDKEVSGEQAALSKELSKKESEIIKKSSEIHESTIQSLSQLHDELQFVTDTKNIINQTRNDLYQLSIGIRSDFEGLTQANENLIKVIADLGTYLNTEQDNMWKALITALSKNCSNLFYNLKPPDGLFTDSDTESQFTTTTNESDDFLEKKKQEVVAKQSGTGLKQDYPCKDLRGELFEINPYITDNTTFVNAVILKCWSSLDALQRASCTFYTGNGNRPLIRVDLLKPDYESAAQAFLKQFHSFALQCEQVWLDTIKRFIPVLGEVKYNFNAYFERRFCEYADKVVAALDNQTVEFTKCVNELGCNLVTELQKLDSKLLALHGYPRNRSLLDSLGDEVVRRTAELELNWELFFKNTKKQLKCFRQTHILRHSELEALKYLQIRLQDAIFIDELGSTILEYLEKWINNNGVIRKKTELPENSPFRNISPERDGFPDEHLIKLDRMSPVLERTDSILAQLKVILESERGRISNAALKFELLSLPADLKDLIKPQMGRMEGRYRELIGLIDSRVDFQKKVTLAWLDTWKANIAKINKLYTVKYPHLDDQSEELPDEYRDSMAELKTHIAKPGKFSASATATLPKLSHKKINCQEPECSTNRKSRSVGSRSFSNEKKYNGSMIESEKINSKNSKTIQTESKPEEDSPQQRTMSNSSLGSESPSKRHSHIPIPSRVPSSLKPGSSRRNPSPENRIPKPNLLLNDKSTSVRTIDFPPDTPRSPSPQRGKQQVNFEKPSSGRSKSTNGRNMSGSKTERTENVKQSEFARKHSPPRRIPDIIQKRVSYTKSYTTVTLSSPKDEFSEPMTPDTPHSDNLENDSLMSNEGDICNASKEEGPNEDELESGFSRTSLHFDFDVQQNKATRHDCGTNCSREFDAEESSQVELLNVNLDESEPEELPRKRPTEEPVKRSMSYESGTSQAVDRLRTPQTTIRTLSGEELVLTSSMEFDLENELGRSTSVRESEETITELLKETDDRFVKAFSSRIRMADDSCDFDSDGTTDNDLSIKSKYAFSETDFANSQNSQPNIYKSEHGFGEGTDNRAGWRNRENELLTDVNYRQFVYHPTVLRRQTQGELAEEKDGLRSRSIEAQSSYASTASGRDKSTRNFNSLKSNFKKNMSHTYVSNRDVNINPLKPWSEKAPQNDEKQIYDSLHLMHNSEYVLKDIKRERSKRERITGAVLRLTAKVIHLLALLNLWPGDNCQLLTSHSLQYGR